MGRIRDDAAYGAARERLLDAGLELMRERSYDGVGVKDILVKSDVPKGSFYHYFESKEAFALAVTNHYHDQLMNGARSILRNERMDPLKRLRSFFDVAQDNLELRSFQHGCLMCNLSNELADTNPVFRTRLDKHWSALSEEVSRCVSLVDKRDIGLEHLTDKEAADWLVNAWSGALTRMKASGDGTPLKLFLKTTFLSRKRRVSST